MKLTTRIENQGPIDGHCHIDVFQDGGKAGVLVVDTRVAIQVRERIEGAEVERLKGQILKRDELWPEFVATAMAYRNFVAKCLRITPNGEQMLVKFSGIEAAKKKLEHLLARAKGVT